MAAKMGRAERRELLVSLLTVGMTVVEIAQRTGLSDTTILRDLDYLVTCRRVHVADEKVGRFRPTKVFVAGPGPDREQVETRETPHARRDPLVAALFGLPSMKGETVDVRAVG